ncbi:MAG: six-cysteine ranthipeptide SCIFF [Christensenellales bacterium]
MKHIKTLITKSHNSDAKTGCGECQSSCQSACKTSCTVGNQTCKQRDVKVNSTFRKPE